VGGGRQWQANQSACEAGDNEMTGKDLMNCRGFEEK